MSLTVDCPACKCPDQHVGMTSKGSLEYQAAHQE